MVQKLEQEISVLTEQRDIQQEEQDSQITALHEEIKSLNQSIHKDSIYIYSLK